jgi:hypothetical protein
MVFAVGPYTGTPLRPADKLPPASGRILVFRRLQAARERREILGSLDDQCGR